MPKKHTGFTLTELLTAVSISTIILLTAGMVIRSGISSWKRGQRKIALDRDAAYAVLTIEKYIRESARSEISVAGDSIDIYRPGEDDPSRRFWLSGKKLITEDLTSSTTMYVVGNVDNLSFSTTTVKSTVKVKLTLDDELFNSFLLTTLKHRCEY